MLDELLRKTALPVMIDDNDDEPDIEDEENDYTGLLDDDEAIEDEELDLDDDNLVNLDLIFNLDEDPDEGGYEDEEEEDEEDLDLYGDEEEEEDDEDDDAFYEEDDF